MANLVDRSDGPADGLAILARLIARAVLRDRSGHEKLLVGPRDLAEATQKESIPALERHHTS